MPGHRVITPEDEYPVCHGAGGPAAVVPLFLLYDYSFRAPGAQTKEQSLPLTELNGRYLVGRGLLLTAVSVE